jgi:uncharacterized protein (DUF4415 family)
MPLHEAGHHAISRACGLSKGQIMVERTRRPGDPKQTAERLFKAATTKPPEEAVKAPSVPNAKELVSLRMDRDVLEHFQEGGPGWQDRINAALRKSAGL